MKQSGPRKDAAVGDHLTAHVHALAALDRALARSPGELHGLLEEVQQALQEAMDERQLALRRYAALFDAVPDPVSILSEDGVVLDLNKAGVRAYGRPREEIIGQPIELLNPDLPSDHLDPVWEALRQGETYVIDVPFPAHFDAPNKRWLHEQGQITWAEVLTRWKARGPMNHEFVGALQRGWSAT